MFFLDEQADFLTLTSRSLRFNSIPYIYTIIDWRWKGEEVQGSDGERGHMLSQVEVNTSLT